MTKQQYRELIEAEQHSALTGKDLFYYLMGVKVCAMTEYDNDFWDELTTLQKQLYGGAEA